MFGSMENLRYRAFIKHPKFRGLQIEKFLFQTWCLFEEHIRLSDDVPRDGRKEG